MMNIGDKVKIIGNSRGNDYLDQYVGKVYEITRVPSASSGCMNSYGLKDHRYWWPECDLRLAAPEPRFKVGQRVTVVDKDTLLESQRKYIGQTMEITEVIPDNFPVTYDYSKRTAYIVNGVSTAFTEDELKEEIMIKQEALKAAIDGAKVKPVDFSGDYTYIDFNGSNFVYHDDSCGAPYFHNASENYLHDCPWHLYVPPQPKPRFSIGSFFCTSKGKLGKVLAEPEFVNGGWKYTVRTDFRENNEAPMFPEESMYEYEEEQ